MQVKATMVHWCVCVWTMGIRLDECYNSMAKLTILFCSTGQVVRWNMDWACSQM